MIEFALTLPLLLMMLAAAAYFGFATTTQQRLAMAARHAARLVAIESTNGATAPMQGSASGQNDNTYVASLGGDRFLELAKEMLPGLEGRLWVSSPDWDRRVRPLGSGYAALYTRKSGQSGFVAGCLFYGCTLNYELTELNWLAAMMGARFWQRGGTGGDIKGLSVSATCVMPGELPLRGRAGGVGFGMFDLNPALIEQARASVNEGMYQNLPPLVEP